MGHNYTRTWFYEVNRTINKEPLSNTPTIAFFLVVCWSILPFFKVFILHYLISIFSSFYFISEMNKEALEKRIKGFLSTSTKESFVSLLISNWFNQLSFQRMDFLWFIYCSSWDSWNVSWCFAHWSFCCRMAPPTSGACGFSEKSLNMWPFLTVTFFFPH